MGVDARIFVRHGGAALDDRAVRTLAAQMCSIIGHERFFINRKPIFAGDPPRHALSVVDTADAIKARGEDYGELDDAPAGVPVWLQDGPALYGEPGEQFIEAHLWSRYYGPGYERGDWPTIRAVIEFLAVNVKDGRVFYGGDSSGMCAEEMTPEKLAEINTLYLTEGHAPYRGYFGRSDGTKPHCAFCADRPMNSVGGGGKSSFWSCDGCGQETVTADGQRYDAPADFKPGDKLGLGFYSAWEQLTADGKITPRPIG